MNRTDGPRRSLAHIAATPRSTLTIASDTETTTDIDIRMHIAALRDEPLLRNCLIGSRKLFGDSSAILMDINDPCVAEQYYNMIDEMFFSSPSLILLHTSTPQEDWSNVMTVSMKNTPLAAIQKMRYRSSNKGGRPFAKAQMLEKEINAFKAGAKAAETSEQEQTRRALLATVSIPTLEAAGREAIADRLVEAMQAATTMTFTNRSTPGDLKKGECRLMQTPKANGQAGSSTKQTARRRSVRVSRRSTGRQWRWMEAATQSRCSATLSPTRIWVHRSSRTAGRLGDEMLAPPRSTSTGEAL